MVFLDDIERFLDLFFAIHRYSQEERGGVYLPSKRPIRRLGLALEPWEQLPQWVKQQRLDALFLHRPWKLQPGQLLPNVGVLSYHLAFDECLTLGFNLRLAEILAMSSLSVLGEKQGRAIGAIGEIPTQSFSSYCTYVDEVFGGQEEVFRGVATEISRVAVVGAMTDALVCEAAARGTDLYITGQFRQPAQDAVRETGIGVIAVGHRRSEVWGLRALSGVLRERWSRLEVFLPPLGYLTPSDRGDRLLKDT
jgi:putative NIF3 family GTP cyclohydrolase 1 type 2